MQPVPILWEVLYAHVMMDTLETEHFVKVSKSLKSLTSFHDEVAKKSYRN